MGDWPSSLSTVRKTVRARSVTDQPRWPIYAVDQTAGIVLTEQGEIISLDLMFSLLRHGVGSIIACHQSPRLLQKMDRKFGDDPSWQFKVAPVIRELYTAPTVHRHKPMIKSTVVSFCGFQRKNNHSGNLYHYPIDPITFHGKTVNELYGENDTRPAVEKLMEWAIGIRQFCLDNQIAIKPTSGGLAASLLRDPRFHRENRRKVPLATNAKSRGFLPGNYYELRARENTEIQTAVYIDQQSAHHYWAEHTHFPHADSLYARGYFHDLRERIWKTGSECDDFINHHHGLFYGVVWSPHFPPRKFPLPYLEPGYSKCAFYSNEVPYLRALGCRIVYLIAAWSTTRVDTTLNDYSRWSQRRIREADRRELVWLKPTLLSTYGILAARPKHIQFGFKRANGGEPTRYPCGSGYIDALGFRTRKEIEPGFANVIHRGMIEAACRVESLRMANELSAKRNIISIYADAIFIEAEDEKGIETTIPLLPPPWRLKEDLSLLRFINTTSFTSLQLTRLPGVSQRDEVLRASRGGIRGAPRPPVVRATRQLLRRGVAPAREWV